MPEQPPHDPSLGERLRSGLGSTLGAARRRLDGSDARAAADADRSDQEAQARAMGKRMREARVRAGLTPGDVEQATRINRVYVEAIEDGRFEALPAPVYARGFARSYARYLGLDPELAAAAVPRTLPRPSGLEPIAGLRRTPPMEWPALDRGTLQIAGAAIAGLVVLLLLLSALGVGIPGLGALGGGSDGGGNADGTGGPTSSATASTTATGTSSTNGGGASDAPLDAVPPFEEGTTPDFRGVDGAVAEALIDQLGATPLVVEAPNDATQGAVYAQSPSPGEALTADDVVTLFVSTGPPPN